MASKKWYLRTFIIIPAIYGLLSAILLIVAVILDTHDPNSPGGFGLVLGVMAANLPGAKTIVMLYGMFYSPKDGAVFTFLFYVGSIVITNLYLGFLLYLGSRMWRRIKRVEIKKGTA